MNVTVIRPYDRRIRERMFDQLNQAGFNINPEQIIPHGTPNDEVLELLKSRLNHILLIPFNSHNDVNGNSTNGLELIIEMHNKLPELTYTPIIMPVSIYAKGAVSIMKDRISKLSNVAESIKRCVLIVHEEKLDHVDLLKSLQDHVAKLSVLKLAGK